MRDTSFDSQNFCSALNEHIHRSLKFSTEVLSRITPSALSNFENSYRLTDCSLDTLVCLAILSWYVPEEVGVILRLELLEKASEKTENCFLQLLLLNEGEMKLFLINTHLWHTRDFFGNILSTDKIKQSLKSVRPRVKSKRAPKRTQRHRGYRDKGTLRKESDKHDLWISTDEQLDLEQQRQNRLDTLLFLQGFIGSGG